MPKLKHSIELVLIGNLSNETYLDTYMVMKAFDCTTLYKSLIEYGVANMKQLRLEQVISQLDSSDQRLIMQK